MPGELNVVWVALMLALSLNSAQAEEAWHNPDDAGWELSKESDGIQAFTREVPGSSVDAFQGRGILRARLESILAIFFDPKACESWVHQCVLSRRHTQGDFGRAIVYGINDFPWPADDRDYVLDSVIDYQPALGRAEIRYEVAESDHEPLNDDYIRVPMMSIRYYLRADNEQETEIIWVQHTDPGGLLPSWLLNMLLVDIPFESLKKLERLANQPEYLQAQASLDESGKPDGWSVKGW